MEQIQIISSILGLVISCGTLGTMCYALSRFLKKPQEAIEDRVTTLEVQMKEVRESLNKGNDHFKSIDEALEVILTSLIALIDFEVNYMLQEDKPVPNELKEARSSLNRFLTSRR